jgi:hypothetical protein
VGAALAALDRVTDLAGATVAAAGDLFRQLNARLFLRFREVRRTQRTVTQVAGGVVTFGAAPAPVALYEGPTGRRALTGQPPAAAIMAAAGDQRAEPCGSGREGESLGNVSRGERI